MRQSAPYNLLFSKQWMWLVPRSREHYQDISVNALGFAGSLFVRDSKQLDLVRNVGPMAMLSAVGVP
jgi:ATP adenylyltransferase